MKIHNTALALGKARVESLPASIAERQILPREPRIPARQQAGHEVAAASGGAASQIISTTGVSMARVRKSVRYALAGAGIAMLAAIPTVASARDVVIHAGALLDGVKRVPQKTMSIVIANDRIVSVQPGFIRPEGAEIIDLSKATVLPGLVEGHVHITTLKRSGNQVQKTVTNSPLDMVLAATVNARDVLEAGFTSVRDVGGLFGTDLALKKAIERGEVVGPRMFVAGEAIGPTGGHNDWSSGYAYDISRDGWGAGIADGPEGVAKKVREERKLGVDQIKILPSGGVISVGDDPEHKLMTDAEIKAAVDTAHALGLKVAAHAHGKSSIDAAVRLGADSIEHATYADAQSFELFRKHGTYLVPTLLTTQLLMQAAKERPDSLAPGAAAKALKVGPMKIRSFAQAYRAGVKIAFGSDTGLGQNAKEFALMVGAGMTPIDAIMSATAATSDLIGASDRIGSIQPGRYADIIAVAGNPLSDITELERVRFVMKGGIVYKREGAPVPVKLINP
jgi:imidazolonepropionase-like amidohydrolase